MDLTSIDLTAFPFACPVNHKKEALLGAFGSYGPVEDWRHSRNLGHDFKDATRTFIEEPCYEKSRVSVRSITQTTEDSQNSFRLTISMIVAP